MIINRDLYATYYQKAKELYQQPVLVASIEVILTVFSITFMILFAINPTLTIVANLQKQIDDQKTFEQKVDSKIVSLNQAQASLTKSADKLPLYQAAVPYDHDLDGLALRIEKLAQETGVAVKSLQFSSVPLIRGGGGNSPGLENTKVPSDEPSGSVKISFAFEGGSESLLKMIEALEKIDRLVLVKDVSLIKQEKGSSSRLIIASGQAETYYGEYITKQK